MSEEAKKKKPLNQRRRVQQMLDQTPEDRNEVHRGLIERGGAGAGRHQNKGTRGTGEKGSGKRQRHPKHKGQREERYASATRVATMYLLSGKGR